MQLHTMYMFIFFVCYSFQNVTKEKLSDIENDLQDEELFTKDDSKVQVILELLYFSGTKTIC